MKQATKDAIAWLIEDPRRTAYKAANKFGISQSTISRALLLEASRTICPECGNWKHNSAGSLSELPKKSGGKIDMAKVFEVVKHEDEDSLV